MSEKIGVAKGHHFVAGYQRIKEPDAAISTLLIFIKVSHFPK
jgi:hypothetical protein